MRRLLLLAVLALVGCSEAPNSLRATSTKNVEAWERLRTPAGGGPDLMRRRVEGGWLYYSSSSQHMTFVPEPK